MWSYILQVIRLYLYLSTSEKRHTHIRWENWISVCNIDLKMETERTTIKMDKFCPIEERSCPAACFNFHFHIHVSDLCALSFLILMIFILMLSLHAIQTPNLQFLPPTNIYYLLLWILLTADTIEQRSVPTEREGTRCGSGKWWINSVTESINPVYNFRFTIDLHSLAQQ